MPLYEIVKADGTREKVSADFWVIGPTNGLALIGKAYTTAYAPGTWLEVWRREGVGE